MVGEKFKTPCGGTIIVEEYTAGVRKQCKCYCSICSKDLELFPEEYFYTSYNSLVKGKFPCACTRYKWNKSQYEVRIKRRCEDLGYSFKGFSGKWCNHKTKLILYNPVTGNTWTTTTINQFLSRKTVDPVIGKELNKSGSIKDYDYHIDKFFSTGNFKEGTIFSKCSEKGKRYESLWMYQCPVCKEDDYTKNGLCTGIFKASESHFKSGKISCRCSKSYRWSKEQREFDIKRTLDSIQGRFIHWSSENHLSNSKFKWSCNKGHTNISSVGKFLKEGQRCYQCSQEDRSFGLYPQRLSEDDYLYVYLFENLPYIKVGRTFDPARRIQENTKRVEDYYRHIGLKEIKITSRVFKGIHEEVYNKEQHLLGNQGGLFSEYKYPIEKWYGSSELLYKEAFPLVINDICSDERFSEVPNK